MVRHLPMVVGFLVILVAAGGIVLFDHTLVAEGVRDMDALPEGEDARVTRPSEAAAGPDIKVATKSFHEDREPSAPPVSQVVLAGVVENDDLERVGGVKVALIPGELPYEQWRERAAAAFGAEGSATDDEGRFTFAVPEASRHHLVLCSEKGRLFLVEDVPAGLASLIVRLPLERSQPVQVTEGQRSGFRITSFERTRPLTIRLSGEVFARQLEATEVRVGIPEVERTTKTHEQATELALVWLAQATKELEAQVKAAAPPPASRPSHGEGEAGSAPAELQQTMERMTHRLAALHAQSKELEGLKVQFVRAVKDLHVAGQAPATETSPPVPPPPRGLHRVAWDEVTGQRFDIWDVAPKPE